MKADKPRFRFAPSPTGGLHIGTARTALFNWISAKSMNGDLILRIEDTDLKRSTEEFEKSIIEGLKWLGFDWDEFYRQSDRIKLYEAEAQRLLKEDKAYMCFCRPERLETLREKLISEGKPIGYDNKCRNMSKEEINENLKNHIEYTIRYKVSDGEIKFNDLIRGEIKFSSDVISDFVLIKSDSTPSYNFAVVVDDNDMKITHVLRGEDHITNTARQILLFNSLGYKIPDFAHLSMILGKDGAKLSKRHGAATISQFRDEGYLREAMANYLSLLSWAPRDGEEIFYLSDILNKFKISDISKNPAIFDIDKLNWLNGIYIRKKSNMDLFDLILPFLLRENIVKSEDLSNIRIKNKILKCVDAFRDNLRTLAQFPDYVRDFFSNEIKYYDQEALEILRLGSSKIVIDMFAEKLQEINLQEKAVGINTDIIIDDEKAREIINEIGNRLKDDNIKGKLLYMPIRASLTGKVHGPELPKVISILGIEECLNRIGGTLNFLIDN
ncbi:MAG: glutamate--tRNA ligase [Actinobacteria bacterium]|nr:glutamate--tRNA ligase [Actinomycetota bacterium]